ncbi:hypothetical protein [Lentzea indica]|uniref:hypothetical protein n=1 Tax=Lentzea indica TaxID=2604800 RepID=UPI00143A0BDE|nr:hypothetical protein [Lentzea indica]
MRAVLRSGIARLLCYVGIPASIVFALLMYAASLVGSYDAGKDCAARQSDSGARNVDVTRSSFPPNATCVFADGATENLVPTSFAVLLWGSIGGSVVCVAGAVFFERRSERLHG